MQKSLYTLPSCDYNVLYMVCIILGHYRIAATLNVNQILWYLISLLHLQTLFIIKSNSEYIVVIFQKYVYMASTKNKVRLELCNSMNTFCNKPDYNQCNPQQIQLCIISKG